MSRRPRRVLVPLQRRRRSLNPDKHLAGSVLGILAVLSLIVLTWFVTTASVRSQRVEAEARAATLLTNQTLAFSEELNRQILAIDQTLLFLARAWERDPAGFALERNRAEALVLSDISRDMILVDEGGIIRQASVPESVGQDVASRDFMAYARKNPTPQGGVYVGGASIDPIMRQWHLNVAVWLRHPDGSFAGAIAADYRVSAIQEVFRQAYVGANGLLMLVGPEDGKVRASSAADADPHNDISASPMVAATRSRPSGLWTGRSAPDSVTRQHAFRRLPNRDLVLIVAMDVQDVLAPATLWQWQATRFAGAIVALLLFAAWLLLRGGDLARARNKAQADEQANLAAANAQLAVARAQADAKAELLEATFASVTEGVSMVDPQFCLVEWNARFAALASIPVDLPRVGLPMEEILRAQAQAGLFGPTDVEAEVNRRMAQLRSGQSATTEHTGPDGRIVEVRRNRLPDGGFVTLYTDITNQKRATEALRGARAAAAASTTTKSRFIAIVSHAIRSAGQSSGAVSALIDDIDEMTRLEAGHIALHPSVFALRPLLDAVAGTVRPEAAEDVPEEAETDPDRLRQVLGHLLSHAIRRAGPGAVTLSVARDHAAGRTAGGLRFEIRDLGPMIDAAARAGLFDPFAQSEADAPDDADFGLAISRHLVGLMGGEIGCDTWRDDTSGGGNVFWFTLPASAVVIPVAPLPPPLPVLPVVQTEDVPRRGLPRTRILVVENLPADQTTVAALLRRGGHMVDIVADGAAAIEAVRNTPYDIVLMDIFLPGMSGQDTTREIRTLPGAAGQIPVIALTATAAPEDEVLFLAAGMNGVLPRPIVPAELHRVLVRHAWRGHPAGEPPEPGTVSEPEDNYEGALAMERVNALRTNLPAEVLWKLAEACLTDLEERLPPFRRALTSRVGVEIESQAHTLADVAAGYGLAALEAKTREIMATAHAGDIEALATAFAETEEAFTRGGAALREVLRKNLATAPPLTDC